MARNSLKEANAKAAKARARMARRAKRARFFKENKKRILLGFVVFLLLLFLAFFTPFGPDYYRSEIDMHKMESPRAVTPGYIRDLYKLGVFYNMTMRKSQALECYDEIGRLFFGFKLVEYSLNPGGAFEKRRQAELNIKRGQGNGPPFVVSEIDIPYVALAIWRTGEIIMHDRSRTFAHTIYRDLYVNEMMEQYPEYLDKDVTEFIVNFNARMLGAR